MLMLAVRYPLSTPRGITSVIGKAKGEPVCSLVFVLRCVEVLDYAHRI